MIGDLHCHSKLSDGSTSLEDIVFYAKRAGLDALAITDHDTLSGASRAQVLGKRYGITVIPGVEISTFDPDTQRRVHILCYLPLKPDRLAGLLSRTLEQRRISGEQMIQKVSRLYPVTREHILRYAAASNSIYKVHIMQALLDLGYDTSIYGQLYAQLFSDSGGSCLVKTVYPRGGFADGQAGARNCRFCSSERLPLDGAGPPFGSQRLHRRHRGLPSAQHPGRPTGAAHPLPAKQSAHHRRHRFSRQLCLPSGKPAGNLRDRRGKFKGYL